jgi:hypothetical protein
MTFVGITNTNAAERPMLVFTAVRG